MLQAPDFWENAIGNFLNLWNLSAVRYKPKHLRRQAYESKVFHFLFNWKRPKIILPSSRSEANTDIGCLKSKSSILSLDYTCDTCLSSIYCIPGTVFCASDLDLNKILITDLKKFSAPGISTRKCSWQLQVVNATIFIQVSWLFWGTFGSRWVCKALNIY